MKDKKGFSKIEPTHTIVIVSPKGKKLTLDFNGSKLKTYGDLKPDKAAEQFFKALDWFFQGAIKKQLK